MKRNILIASFTAIILLAGLIVTLTSSASGEKKQEAPACCKSDKTECMDNKQKTGSGELIMENMSRQFISI